MTTVIVDYGIGNLGAIPNMLRRLDVAAEITSDPDTIRRASKVILPGVGAFDAGMRRLREMRLDTVLDELVADPNVTILGLCLGMHLMFDGSSEGSEPGLGWISGQVVKLEQPPVPHMGWGLLSVRRPHAILDGLGPEARFYFAHSYYASCSNPADILAMSDAFPAIVGHANVIGTQFHPEKSHRFGLQLFRNFVQ